MSNIILRASIASLMLPALAYANTNEQLPYVELEPTVITISRNSEPASKAPARINVINQKVIEQNPLSNLSNTLTQDPSITLNSNGGMGQTGYIALRGGKQTHTLVLKDGARLNNQNDVTVLQTAYLDLTDVNQIEVAKGPASVQYGADAISGVVQMRSLEPRENSVFATGIYGENNTYKAIVGADMLADNGIYAQVRGQRLESDGTRILSYQSPHNQASYDQKGYSAKVGYGNDYLDASVSINENKGTNIFTSDSVNNTAYRLFKNRLINAKADYDATDTLTLSARYSIFNEDQNVLAYKSNYDSQNKEADINAKWTFHPNQNLLFGVTRLDAKFESSSIKGKKQDINTTGYYLQHQYDDERFNTQVGVRVEDNEHFGTHTVGQGAVRYHLNPKSSVYANIGSAFRAPTLNELYTDWGGNEELKPEESLSYEVGFDHALTQHTRAYISAYRTDTKNLIQSIEIKPFTYSNINIDKAQFTGGETGVKWSKDGLFVRADYAYVETKDKASNLEMAYRPKHTLTASTGVAKDDYGVSIALTARSNAYTDKANTSKIAGYATVDVGTYWQINPHVKFFANIENIGDVQYKQADNFGNGWYVNGGRFASAGLTFKY